MLKKINYGLSVLRLHSKNVLLEILPEKGGRIIRYNLKTKDKTFELLRPVNPLVLNRKEQLQKTSFPLVPFSNRINNGLFSFRGKQIQLPLNYPPEPHAIHGHGWLKKWNVTEVKENFAILEYQYMPDEWPFPYLARQVFELDDSNLTIILQIKNIGGSSMPAGLGLHPYFVRTPNSIVTAETEKMWINNSHKIPLSLKKTQEIKLLYNGLNINKNVLDNIFTGWNHIVKISWPEWKVNLFLETKHPLDYLIIYSPPGEDYFCVEPVSNITDAFNMMEKNIEGHGATILDPGEIIEGKIIFSPEFF